MKTKVQLVITGRSDFPMANLVTLRHNYSAAQSFRVALYCPPPLSNETFIIIVGKISTQVLISNLSAATTTGHILPFAQ